MKRKGWVFDKVISMDNLRLAYWKASKRKHLKADVIKFGYPSVEANLVSLRRALEDGNFEIGRYHYFKIYEPKERNIVAATFTDRILHHAIINICEADFEKFHVFHSYACRKGKGVHVALEVAREYHRKYRYCVKMDIRKYFDSIDHNILISQLHRMYKDAKLLNLFTDIIKSYEVSPCKGIPIGNLTSQYFANHYLGYADHFAKEKLKVIAYVRYMDDIMMWGNDRSQLLYDAKSLRNYLKDKLKLDLKIFLCAPTSAYIVFLGYRISRYGLKLSSTSAKRYIKKVIRMFELYNLGLADQNCLYRQLQSSVAFVNRANATAIKKRAIELAIDKW